MPQTIWLPDPAGPDEVLAEGMLEPATADAVERVSAGLRDGGDRLSEDDVRDLPVVSIGKPEHVPLREVYAELPPSVAENLGSDDYYLVRLTCSFLPAKGELEIDWARFLVHLLEDAAGRRPVVFDLYPQDVTQAVEHDLRVTLTPSVKFTEVEASAGGVAFGYKYSELQPSVTAVTVDDGAKAVWDYERAKGSPVRGWKKMYLLVKAPPEMQAGEARIELAADVLIRGRIPLPVVFQRRREIAAQGVTARLWGSRT